MFLSCVFFSRGPALELNARRFFRRRRRARLGVICGELTMRSRDQPDCPFGVISPAVGIGVLLANVTNAGNLIFQSSTVALIENRRCYEDEQIALVPFVVVTLKRVTEHRDVAKERN